MSAFLGEQLFREALDAGDLTPFDDVTAAVRDKNASTIDRANALKAGRFALAGLVICSWEDHVTDLLDGPLPFGEDTLTARFKSSVLPPHDSALIDRRTSSSDRYAIPLTQGTHALDVVQAHLIDSASKHFSESHTTKGIPLTGIFEALRELIVLGRELASIPYRT